MAAGAKIKFQFTTIGLLDIQARLAAIQNSSTMIQILASKVFQDASRIIYAAQKIVPVKTGNLRATGHAEVPTVTTTSVRCVFGFGGPAAPYAFIVHENLRARHENGVAKYLEIPYLNYLFGGLEDFITELRAADIFGRASARVGSGL